MKLSEFKAFIEGLEHGFRGDAPSPEQWQLIKDKLHQVRTETSQVSLRQSGLDKALEEAIKDREKSQIRRPDGWPEVKPYFGHEPHPNCDPFYPIKPAEPRYMVKRKTVDLQYPDIPRPMPMMGKVVSST